MKASFKATMCTAGIAVAVLTGCVSTKKYKASQAALQQVRNDSTQLASQVAALNGNVHDLQQKNGDLQKSLDKSSSDYTSSQKDLGYYRDYFTRQQSEMSQVSDQLKTAMSQAGLGDADIQQANNCIYVRLDEDKIFKKNTMMVTSSGKQALNSLAQTFKDRSDVNVFVSDGDSTGGASSTTTAMSPGTGNNMAQENAATGEMPAHHTTHHRVHRTTSTHDATAANGTRSSAAGTGSSGSVASNGNQATGSQGQSTAKNSTTAVHHKPHHHHYASSEGSMAYSSNMGMHHNKAWMMKEGRMYAVANNFLQDGVSKVNLTLHQPVGISTSQNKTLKVIIAPKMEDFNPQSGSSASTDNK
jgi:hypothetical protein